MDHFIQKRGNAVPLRPRPTTPLYTGPTSVTVRSVEHVGNWHRPLAERVFLEVYQSSLHAMCRCRLLMLLGLGYQHIKLLLCEYDAMV